jgi:uncharacterized cupin superfamily protein
VESIMPVTVAKLVEPLPSISLPQHEILEGAPSAGGRFTAESADHNAIAGFWSCDVGRYAFYFGYDEFVYIIRGEVIVTELGAPDEHGQPRIANRYALGPGDTAHFPQGVTTRWEITRPLTKYFVAREPFAEPAGASLSTSPVP